ncbi:MAG: glycosyltransferase family 2 protein, partial [Pseudomonadales bacterium]|nr:glycosyltransferase family 2 protein [Pseudomonadales bacterium]
MPKSVPELSIITPNFNCLPYLDAWLNSILQQSYNEYEIIVVDDGSTDGSKTWLNEKEKQLECLTVIYENKLGPGGARNTAAQIARGRYLAFLDADDVWLPGKLEQQMRFHKNNPEVVLSFTDYEHIKEGTGDAII